MKKNLNFINYNDIGGYVNVTVVGRNKFDTKHEFNFIAFVDKDLSCELKHFHLSDIAAHLGWLRRLFFTEIIKIEKSNLTEVVK